MAVERGDVGERQAPQHAVHGRGGIANRGQPTLAHDGQPTPLEPGEPSAFERGKRRPWPRRSSGAIGEIAGIDPLGAQSLDVVDDALLANLRQDRVQVLDVAHLKIDDEAPEIGGAGRGGDGSIFAPYSPDRRGDHAERAGLVQSVTTTWVE